MRRLSYLLALMLWLSGCACVQAAFGLTTATDYYSVDTGANLVFKVRRTDNGVSTQSAGDLMSLVYNGVEYQDTSRGSQLNSGFDYLYTGVSAVTVSAAVLNTSYIKITVTAGNLTHYYMARSGFAHIYMATYFTAEPDTLGLCRYIVRIPSTKLPNGPVPSDIRTTTSTVESGDIFGMADGTTRSKHYSNMRLKDWAYIGATGTKVGVWMMRSNHEGDSGGPFYRSLLNQCGDDQEITYIINYGEGQTEAFRTSILNGPYALIFNGGTAPTAPDTSWVANMRLTGFVGAAGRGTVSATGIAGRDGACAYTVGFSNTAAQYWTDSAGATGAFSLSGIIPGIYTMKVYKNELAVYSADVTVGAGATAALGNLSIGADPSATLPLWRVGNWDGSPGEFLNGDKVTTMHPSDVRMAAWSPGPYVIGTSTPGTGMPCYQWNDVNGNQVIQFKLTAAQLVASTVRVGITCAYAGARPKISLNAWTYPSNPAASTQPATRTLTVGTYRGNNTTYTFAVPASALIAGTNTLTVFPISGSGATGFLSAGYSLDCIDMYQGTAQTLALPPAPVSLSATGINGQVSLSWPAVDAVTSYIVRRATVPGGPYITLATVSGATGYADGSVANGTTYFYAVSSVNSTGAGAVSPEARLTAGGLVAFYAMGGNAQDSSGGAFHGSAVAVTYPIDTAGAQSALFNGTTSRIVIPRSVQDDFTVALWVKTTITGGTGTAWGAGKGLVDGDSTGTAADWGLALLQGKVAFGVGNPDATFFSKTLINDGAWHHVAATRRNTSGAIEIYVDGALQTTGTAAVGSRVAPSSLCIGSLQSGTGFFSGGLDGVRLYNKVLTAPEIAAIIGAGMQIPAAPGGLGATVVNASQINLSWSASPTAASYNLKRANLSGGPYSVVASGLTTTSFGDTGLTSGAYYFYVVSAVNANGESADSAPANAMPLGTRPVAHLRFDESSGTLASDSSANAWNGTLVNGPLWVTGANAKINNAISLDGINDHLTLPAGITSGLDDFTLAVWIKWNGGNDWQRIADFGTGTANYFFLTPHSSAGTVRFAIRTAAIAEQQINGAAVTIGAWTHIAVTISGGTGTLYVNGVASGTNPAMTLKPSSLGGTSLNFLGRSQFTADPYFAGALDDLRLYNRALGAQEIAALAAPPDVPAGFAATPGDGRVALSWNATAGAGSYQLKRATVSGGPFTVLASALPTTAFTDSAVTNGSTYFYAITAFSGEAESSRSAQLSATPLSAIQAWRLEKFGFITDSGIAANSADPDRDGTLNETEFRLGLDPKSGASSFKADIKMIAGGCQINWPAAPGLTFEIHRGTTVQDLGQLLGTVTGIGTFTDTAPPPGAAFYRIVLLP